MLLVCRFEVDEESTNGFVQRAERALRLLSARDGCRDAELARATERDGSWILVARFESVSAYRRAMSGVEIREAVVPLLSEARVEEPAAHEPVLTATGGELARHAGVLARDPANPGVSGRERPR